jgi:hypothetical protein
VPSQVSACEFKMSSLFGGKNKESSTRSTFQDHGNDLGFKQKRKR